MGDRGFRVGFQADTRDYSRHRVQTAAGELSSKVSYSSFCSLTSFASRSRHMVTLAVKPFMLYPFQSEVITKPVFSVVIPFVETISVV